MHLLVSLPFLFSLAFTTNQHHPVDSRLADGLCVGQVIQVFRDRSRCVILLTAAPEVSELFLHDKPLRRHRDTRTTAQQDEIHHT